MPFGTPLFLWLRDNKYAQYAIATLAAIVAFLTWQRLRDMRIRREATAKANRQAEKQAVKILKEMDKDVEDTVKAADRAADSVPDDVTSSSLPNAISRFIKRSGPSDTGS